MRQNPSFTLTDRAEIERIIRENPWGTFVSNASTGLVASHYPVILDDTREELTIVSHVGRPDEQLHELGEHELLVSCRARTATSRRPGTTPTRPCRPGTSSPCTSPECRSC
ncbi:hypothetical protein GCM10023068_26210 [Leifsonia shinshuensis]|uniref:Putative FMN-binding regulatory protein PaiB n=1 Tax=Leifsonia shinshuensis TaxID=150026 RepID=A0A853CT90_9MICO|nr:putative FMN-binding regulatory protein PaiB [Leifsonia shinshuensis]